MTGPVHHEVFADLFALGNLEDGDEVLTLVHTEGLALVAYDGTVDGPRPDHELPAAADRFPVVVPGSPVRLGNLLVNALGIDRLGLLGKHTGGPQTHGGHEGQQ